MPADMLSRGITLRPGDSHSQRVTVLFNVGPGPRSRCCSCHVEPTDRTTSHGTARPWGTGGALPTGSHWGLPSTGVAVGFFNRGARSFPGPRTLPGHQSDGAWRRDSTVGRGWPGAHGDDAHPRGRRRLRVPHLRQPQQLQRHQDRERPPAVWSPAGVSNYKPAASTSHRWAPIYTLGLPRVPSSLAS